MDTELLENVKYGEHERQVFDIAFPKNGKGEIGLILCIHGGAWTAGTKSLYYNDIQTLASMGFVAASTNYRYVSKEYHCSDQIDDIEGALAEIKKIGKDRGIEISKVLLTGVSAGAHLSLLYAYSRYKTAPISPAAVISNCGPADFTDREIMEKYMYENEMGGKEHMFDLHSIFCGFEFTPENLYSDEAAEFSAKVSPVAYADENSVPTILCHGEEDIIVPYGNAVNLKKALDYYSVENELITYPNSGHGLNNDPDCSEKAKEKSKEYIFRYLNVFSEN